MKNFIVNTPQGFCNLFAEFLCEEISEKGKYDTVINVVDLDSIIVLKGFSETNKIWVSQDLISDFISKYCGEFTFKNIENINTLDLISYSKDNKLPSKKLKFKFYRDIQISNLSEFISFKPSTNSEFPYGYSKFYLKNLYLYLEMIVYNIQNYLNYTFIEIDVEENIDGTVNLVNIITDSIYSPSKIKSIILDNFDMNIEEINKIIMNHDFIRYYLYDQNKRPWLKIKENSMFQVI